MLPAILVLAAVQASDPRPTFDEFMGVNGHTVQFRPAL
jgi:hypothetical protein